LSQKKKKKKKEEEEEERKKKKKNKLSLMDGDLLKHAAVATDQFFFVAKAIIISCNWRSICSIRILLSKKFHNYIIKMFTLVSRTLQIRIPSCRRRQLLQWLIQAASKQASKHRGWSWGFLRLLPKTYFWHDAVWSSCSFLHTELFKSWTQTANAHVSRCWSRLEWCYELGMGDRCIGFWIEKSAVSNSVCEQIVSHWGSNNFLKTNCFGCRCFGFQALAAILVIWSQNRMGASASASSSSRNASAVIITMHQLVMQI
jgi:hypothetical protein